MTYEMILEALDNIHPGSFVRIGYNTEIPLKSSYAKQGYKLTRISESTVRTGIRYSNIKSVIQEREGRMEPARSYRKTIVPVIQNKIYKNKDTDQLYLRVYPTSKGTNKVSTYVLVSPNGASYISSTIDSPMREMVRDSYFDNKFRPISMIKLDNVHRIGEYKDY